MERLLAASIRGRGLGSCLVLRFCLDASGDAPGAILLWHWKRRKPKVRRPGVEQLNLGREVLERSVDSGQKGTSWDFLGIHECG